MVTCQSEDDLGTLNGLVAKKTPEEIKRMASIPWDDINSCPPSHYAINGTRFNNSACIPCPIGPDNSSSVGNGTVCEWKCDDGYGTTIEW